MVDRLSQRRHRADHQCGDDHSRAVGRFKLQADKFLSVETLGILALRAIAFCVSGTAAGVLMGKVMHLRVPGQR